MRRVFLFGHHGRQRDEIGNDGDDVDDIHNVAEEIQFVRAGEEPHGQLERKPYNTYSLYEEERVCNVGHLVLFYLGTVCRRIEHFVVLKFWQGLEAEDDDGEEDDEDGDDGHHAGRLRALRVFE